MAARSAEQEAEGDDVERLLALFRSLDTNGDGRIEAEELKAALEQLGLPSSSPYLRELLCQYDLDADHEISFEEFRRYVATKEARMQRAFRRVDTDHSGTLEAREVQAAVADLGLSVAPQEVDRMIQLLDRDGDRRICYQEFRRFVVLLPGPQVRSTSILFAWLDSSDWLYWSDYRVDHIPPRQSLERFLAGGLAGALSRTVGGPFLSTNHRGKLVAPLERLRTIMMADRSATRLGPVLGRMWAEGGVWGLFRGNLASVVKVFPSSAVQYGVYDLAKEALSRHNRGVELSHAQQSLAGFISGAAACTLCYPLDTLRTQIQVAQGSGAGGGYGAILQAALAQRGVRSLYQGFPAALANYGASGALGFASYEVLLSNYTRRVTLGDPPSATARGALGGVAAFVTMLFTLPLENVARRLQAQGRPGFPRRYSGSLDCAVQMLQQEGLASFWRGSVSTALKIVPSIAATRLLYETILAQRGVGGVRRYRPASEGGGG